MPRARLVLWRDHAELLDVRSGFYPSPDGQDRRRDAVNVVRAWSVRGVVPHLIDSTSLLTQAVLNDTPDVPQQVVCLTYSAAFCRFVTGLTDKALKGAFHRTMYKVARHLGLPAALVELRHAATHQKLLSLSVLRKAVRRSLEWLWDNYWVRIDNDRSMEKDADVDHPSEIEEYKDLFRRILRPYKQSRVMRAKQKMRFDEDETIKASQRIRDICSENIDRISIIVEVLLEPRFIIPDGRRLEDRAPLDIGFSLWNDILRTLSNSMISIFLPALLDGLLDDLCEQPTKPARNDMHKDNVCLWISHILLSYEWKETISTVNIDLESVLQKCFINPNDWFVFSSTTSSLQHPTYKHLRTLKVASRLLTANEKLESDYAELALLAQIQLKADFQLPEFLMGKEYDKVQMEEAETQLISDVRREVEEFEANSLRLRLLLDQTPTYDSSAEEDLDAVTLMSEDSSDNEDEQRIAAIPSNFQDKNGTAQGRRRYVGEWTPKPDETPQGWKRYEGQWIPKPIGLA